MSTTTPNYGLKKPATAEFYNVEDQNGNMDIIDAKLEDLNDNKEGLIKNAAAKTSMVDADTVPLSDSAAANSTKKITFANLKAALKTYFDTLYNNYVHPTTNGNKHLPVDGAAGQFVKYSGTAGTGSWAAVAKADVGLGNVTNESKTTMFTSPAFTGSKPTENGNMMYSAGNITVSTTAPGAVLAEGYIHMVY
jgi:hypothetical protein